MSTDGVATAAGNNPLLSTLVTAVKRAGLVDTLNNTEDITVFAPDNDAFGALGKTTLSKALADKSQLTKILTTHVVKGRLAPADLAGTHETLSGSSDHGHGRRRRLHGQRQRPGGVRQHPDRERHRVRDRPRPDARLRRGRHGRAGGRGGPSGPRRERAARTGRAVTDDFPSWLTAVAVVSLAVAGLCALLVVVDVVRRPQPMGVMNVVWPVTMLFGSIGWLAFYARRGRAARRGDGPAGPERSMRSAVAVGTSHCGAGCTIGDLVGEFGLVLVPGLAAVFGLGWLFTDRMFAGWVLDFVLAYLVGIVFQYFSIAPTRGLGLRAGLWAAVKADTFSITSWQVGMYGVMALGQLWLLPAWFGRRSDALQPEFWLLMQVAMVVGFATAYPVNWLLVRRGLKEKM